MTDNSLLWIGPGVARALVAVLAARGADPHPVLKALGVGAERLGDQDTRLPFEAFARAWEAAVDATGDELLPLAVGGALPLASYDVLGFACQTAATARDAIERFCRFNRLFTNAGALELVVPAAGPAELHWRAAAPLGRRYRLVDESVVAGARSHSRELLGPDVRPSRVWFRHPPPEDPRPLREFFGAPVEFGAASSGLAFARPLLDARPRGADAAMAEYFGRVAEAGLARRQADDSLGARVAEVLGRELSSGEPSAFLIARRLAMSERTLRRRLAEEGTSLRALLERVRRDRAAALLRDAGLSVGETAFLLGFAEVSSFSRAYRRWFGVPPTEHKAAPPPH
jgi:AraC-like DNA-binding protein